jgi:putative hydrolase
VDLLGHPGYISEEAARAALENEVFVELSGREVYAPTNEHIARVAQQVGCKLLVNSDSHNPEQMLTIPRAEKVAREAGLSEDEIYRALGTNAEALLQRTLQLSVA